MIIGRKIVQAADNLFTFSWIYIICYFHMYIIKCRMKMNYKLHTQHTGNTCFFIILNNSSDRSWIWALVIPVLIHYPRTSPEYCRAFQFKFEFQPWAKYGFAHVLYPAAKYIQVYFFSLPAFMLDIPPSYFHTPISGEHSCHTERAKSPITSVLCAW